MTTGRGLSACQLMAAGRTDVGFSLARSPWLVRRRPPAGSHIWFLFLLRAESSRCDAPKIPHKPGVDSPRLRSRYRRDDAGIHREPLAQQKSRTDEECGDCFGTRWPGGARKPKDLYRRPERAAYRKSE